MLGTELDEIILLGLAEASRFSKLHKVNPGAFHASLLIDPIGVSGW